MFSDLEDNEKLIIATLLDLPFKDMFFTDASVKIRVESIIWPGFRP